MKSFVIGVITLFIIGLYMDIHHMYKTKKVDDNIASTIMIELMIITWGIVALILG